MPLILAIDHDKRQSTQLASLVKTQLRAELVQRGTVAEAVEALKGRVPDLVLTSSLLSPRDDAALAAHLRELGAAAAHVQTVTIPLLGSSAPQRAKGVLAALRREKPQPAMTDGCAPDVFAEQIRQYLATAEEQKVAAATMAQAYAAAPASPAPIETDAYLYEAGRQTDLDAFMEPALAEAPGIGVAPPAAIAEPFAAYEDQVASHEATLQAFEAWPAPQAPAIANETYIAATVDDDALVESSACSEPIFVEPAPLPEPEPEVVAVAEPPAFDDIAVAAAVEVEPDVLVADEPAGLPLSQLLQLVSDSRPRAARTSAPPVAPLEPVAAVPAGPVVSVEEPWPGEPIVAAEEPWPAEPVALIDPLAALAADPAIVEPSDGAEPGTPAVRTDDFGELSLDPVAAQALEELSRLAPAASLADGIPAEAPVPVVEMKSFQSLDSIANELAAGPGPKYDNLDDLASLFAAAPAPRRPDPGAAFGVARPAAETHAFESLFATPAPAASAAPIAVPGIDPSLFAAPSAHAVTADPPAHAPLAEPASIESLFVPLAAEYTELAAAPVTFEEPVHAAAPMAETVLREPVLPEPIIEEALPDTFTPVLSVEAIPVETPQPEAVAATPEYDEPVLPEAVLEDATLPDALLAEFELPEREPAFAEAAAPEPALFEPIPAVATPEPAVAVQAKTDAVAAEFDEEIAIDVDGFDMPAVAPAPAAAAGPPDTRFSFTFVESFGDAWSDFEAPDGDAVAAASPAFTLDGSTDWFSTPPQPAATSAEAQLSAPVLDDEALSMIGDAARKVSLDSMVVEEFERGIRRVVRKPAKPKKAPSVAAPAAPAAPAAERTGKKKGPVQDEWGLFDPEQCGFAALEEEDSADSPKRPARDGTRVRVISY